MYLIIIALRQQCLFVLIFLPPQIQHKFYFACWWMHGVIKSFQKFCHYIIFPISDCLIGWVVSISTEPCDNNRIPTWLKSSKSDKECWQWQTWRSIILITLSHHAAVHYSVGKCSWSMWLPRELWAWDLFLYF